MDNENLRSKYTAITLEAMKAVERCLFHACLMDGQCSARELRRAIATATVSKESEKTEIGTRRLQQILQHLREGYGDANAVIVRQQIDGNLGTAYHLANPYHLLFPEIAAEEDGHIIDRLLAVTALFQFPLVESFQHFKEKYLLERLNENNVAPGLLSSTLRGDVLKKFLQLYLAIIHTQVVEISYTPKGEKIPRRLVVSPLTLRQFNGKWYLITHENATGASRWSVFPIDDRLDDNISEYRGSTHHAYVPVPASEIRNYYSHVYGFSVPRDMGLVNADADPCEIKNLKTYDVSFRVISREAFDYIRWNPLIKSQYIDQATQTVTLPSIVLSQSLASRLMYWGHCLTDVQPKELRELLLETARLVVENIGQK